MATRASPHLWIGSKTRRNLPAFRTQILHLPSRLSLTSRWRPRILMLAVKQAVRGRSGRTDSARFTAAASPTSAGFPGTLAGNAMIPGSSTVSICQV